MSPICAIPAFAFSAYKMWAIEVRILTVSTILIFLNMDQSSSVAAAFHAGKFPSQQQISKAIDSALSSPFLTNEPSDDVGELSEQGRKVQDGFRQLLLAYKKLGDNKNGAYHIASCVHLLLTMSIKPTTSFKSPFGICRKQTSPMSLHPPPRLTPSRQRPTPVRSPMPSAP